jgi:hypothetical protein
VTPVVPRQNTPVWGSPNASLLSDDNLESPLTTSYLVIKPEVLSPGGTYVFTTSVSSGSDAKVSADIHLITRCWLWARLHSLVACIASSWSV